MLLIPLLYHMFCVIKQTQSETLVIDRQATGTDQTHTADRTSGNTAPISEW